ncbi:hypothetical protein WJX77_005166 [Trebouxia sp. C0004]
MKINSLHATSCLTSNKPCTFVIQPDFQCRIDPSLQPRKRRAANFTAPLTCRSVLSSRTQTSVQLNEVSNKALLAMLSHKTQDAQQVEEELKDIMHALAANGEHQGTQYVSVLQGLLNHTVLDEIEELEGMYKQAFDRIMNQVAGSDWKLSVKGQSAEANQEPQFANWDDVFSKKQSANSSTSGNNASTRQPSTVQVTTGLNRVIDDTFYRVLGVAIDADQADIKSAYRKAALKLHPDVSNAPDATQQFAQLSSAYDILSDPISRQLYNQFGPDGMKQHLGAQAGQGNARDAWDEFKPFTKENKRTKARAASQAGTSADGHLDATSNDEGMPVMGDVVEYPLSEVTRQQLQDGRTHGVGLLVGRNKDRGDAKKLPAEALGLCEVEPLRQEEPDSDRWIPDELGVSSFAQLDDLKTIPVTSFDARFDIWHVEAPLSDGCGGPELPEEVIL